MEKSIESVLYWKSMWIMWVGFFFQETRTISEEVQIAKLPHLDPRDVIGCHDNYQVNYLMQWDSFMYDMANDVITLTLKEDKKVRT